MTSQRPVLRPFKRPNEISKIFLGIDFGTSFTKVSYSIAPTNNIQIKSLKWEDSSYENGYVIPTVLYVHDNKLYYEKTEADSLEVKYFKYSMLAPSLLNNHQNTKNIFEEMCCVYYLAQVIKRSLKKIETEMQIQTLDGIQITVHMGAPLENFYNEKEKQNKDLYLTILEKAIVLAGGSKIKTQLPDNCVLISNLDFVTSELNEKKAVIEWNYDVIPELAAEIFLYHQSKFIPEGLYAIIDIGGGTVDMAIFEKHKFKHDAPAGMYCLDQKVLPFGVEILESNKDNISLKDFQDAFADMIMASPRRMEGFYEDLQKVDVFFLGGGANHNWYKSAIIETQHRLTDSFKPKLNFKHSIDDFIIEDEKLITKNQRLIISQMISKTKDDIVSVLGYPPDFKATEDQSRIAKLIYGTKPSFIEDDPAKRSGWDDSTV